MNKIIGSVFLGVIVIAAVLYTQSMISANIMYVDSPDGLRVHSSPNIDSEKIFLLQNKSRVDILQTNDEKVNIDGVLGNWVLIKTNAVRGWVFGGYLVQELDNATDNWINCKTYKYIKERSYQDYSNNISSDTSAFEFIAKFLKNYFYPNIITKDFYLSFYYPLKRYIPEYQDRLFEETQLEIQEDNVMHHIKYSSQRSYGNSYIITVGQYKNNILIREMQFTIIFYEGRIESPELIDKELEQRIRLLDLIDKDLELKIKTAHTLKDLYETTGLTEGLFSGIIIEQFDFFNLRDTDFSVSYIEILQNNGIVINDMDREILKRLLHYEVLNYK
jgi:hypothetical protein